MPDLATALAAMGGGDMTIFQATVDAVGEGVATIHVNGGSFTDVPYLVGAFYPQFAPSIGDPCYVIGRKDWGMLVIGKPAPGPTRSGGDSQVVEWLPFTRSRANGGTSWTAPPLDVMRIAPDGTQAAVYFFNPASSGWTYDALSTGSFYLDVSDIDTGGIGLDNAYVTIGLHATAAPGQAFAPLANLDADYRVNANGGFEGYVSIPLDWAARLLNGTAKGIYVRVQDFPMTISGPGTLRLTSL